MFYVSSNKKLKRILMEKLFFIVFIPTILSFVLISIIIFLHTYYGKDTIGIYWVIAILILNLIIAFVTTLLFIIKVNSLLTPPLSSLLQITRNIGAGNYHFDFPEFELTEFYHVAESFSIMAGQIKTRESELHEYREVLEDMVAKRTEELSATVETLKHTQTRLVESEKMASLGMLVTGISHELNTPLGIIITGLSYLGEEIELLKDDFNAGKISANKLDTYICGSKETLDLIFGNSRKLSKLLNDFKMVANDQVVEDMREFEVTDYIQLVISNIKRKYKRSNIDIDFQYDDEIVVNTDPGALYKVFYNLISNSYEHGFPHEKPGKIIIQLNKVHGNVEIRFSDNGLGMDEESISKIFDPFFTTNRGGGSTGLGMFIAYNQLTQTLNGSISSFTKANKGVEFKLSFPIDG